MVETRMGRNAASMYKRRQTKGMEMESEADQGGRRGAAAEEQREAGGDAGKGKNRNPKGKSKKGEG
jgi:hypothetical protein